MDDKLLQCFALATSLVSAVAAVLAFTQSGWRNTVRATLFVVGAGSVVYVVLIPDREPPANRAEGVPVHGTLAPQESGRVERPSGSLPAANILSPASPAQVDRPAAAASRRPAGSEILPSPVPSFQPPRSAAPSGVAAAASSILSLLDPVGTPRSLPHRYPSVYLPTEVLECPRCRMPYSSFDSGRGVKCPVCSQVVDLVPSGRYFTIHCCCGNWIQSPYQYPENGPHGTRQEIPYFCPRCRAQGTIIRSTAGRN